MKHLVILLLLLASVFASINLKIRSGGGGAVNVNGESSSIISETEKRTFDLTDDRIKTGIERVFGKRPDDVFLKSPTPWNDLYSSNGWYQITRHVKPVSSDVLGTNIVPTVISKKRFINRSNIKATYTASVSQQVEDTVTSSWDTIHQISVGQEINYNIEFPLNSAGAGGTTSIQYTGSWGKGQSHIKTVTLSDSSSVEVILDPGQEIEVIISASRGTMDVFVTYESSLSGDVAMHYASQLNGHYFWSLNIGNILEALNFGNSLYTTETIQISFYTEATILVQDVNSNQILAASELNVN